MSATLTADQALKLVGEIFVYHMPFNRALGLELERYEKDFAQLSFSNQPMHSPWWGDRLGPRRCRRAGLRRQYPDPPRHH